MQKLHFVAVTPARDGLVLSAQPGGSAGEYVLPLEGALVEALDDLYDAERASSDPAARASVRRPSPSAGKSILSVREIQERLRIGRSIDQVAEEAEVDPSWIERFAAPIITEQNGMVERAIAKTFARPRKGVSARPLLESVSENLYEKGIQLTDEEIRQGWSSYLLKGEVDRWAIRFQFRSSGRRQTAEWEFDPASSALTARNRLGAQLGFIDEDILNATGAAREAARAKGRSLARPKKADSPARPKDDVADEPADERDGPGEASEARKAPAPREFDIDDDRPRPARATRGTDINLVMTRAKLASAGPRRDPRPPARQPAPKSAPRRSVPLPAVTAQPSRVGPLPARPGPRASAPPASRAAPETALPKRRPPAPAPTPSQPGSASEGSPGPAGQPASSPASGGPPSGPPAPPRASRQPAAPRRKRRSAGPRPKAGSGGPPIAAASGPTPRSPEAQAETPKLALPAVPRASDFDDLPPPPAAPLPRKPIEPAAPHRDPADGAPEYIPASVRPAPAASVGTPRPTADLVKRRRILGRRATLGGAMQAAEDRRADDGGRSADGGGRDADASGGGGADATALAPPQPTPPVTAKPRVVFRRDLVQPAGEAAKPARRRDGRLTAPPPPTDS